MIGNSHSGYDREDHDYYVEPTWAVNLLFDHERFEGGIYDPACGSGTIPKAAIAKGYVAVGTDWMDRGYGQSERDFFDFRMKVPNIVSNPPYGVLFPFVKHAIDLATHKVAIIARLSFLESQERHRWFKAGGLRRVWVCSRRVSMPPGNKPHVKPKNGSIPYAWFVWERGYTAKPEIDWLP